MVQVVPNVITFNPIATEQNQTAVIYGKSPGHVEITATASPKDAIEYGAGAFDLSLSLSIESKNEKFSN